MVLESELFMQGSSHPLVLVIVAFCLTAPACGSSSSSDDDPAFAPESGNWLFMETSVSTNCPHDFLPPVPTNFELSYDSAGSFRVEIDEELEPVTCQIDETEFVCSELLELVEVFGLDTTFVERRTTWQGGFSSATEMVGVATSVMTCMGDECELVLLGGANTCSKQSTFEAQAL